MTVRRGPAARELVDLLGSYLHLDDDGHVWFTLAIAVSAYLDGDPLWGMLVGPSSSGKTEAIRALDGIAEHVDELTAPALLSWSGSKKRNQPSQPVGLLTRIGTRGLLTVSDFSTVLATSDRGGRDQLFALLRRAYDGEVTRDLGNAPEPLRWAGRLTMIAGVTPAIDNYSSHADQLGPRWLYYRLAARDTQTKRAVAQAARRIADVERLRAEASELGREIVRDAVSEARRITLPDDLTEPIDDMAIVVCYGRGAVPRNGYGRREIEGLAIIEEPGRVTKQLAILARCLLSLGLDPDTAVKLCRRAALDSIPETRRLVLDLLADGSKYTASEVGRLVGCSRFLARMTVEDLAAIGIVDPLFDEDDEDLPSTAPRPWALGDRDYLLLSTVLRAPRYGIGNQDQEEVLVAKSGNPPPNTPQEIEETEAGTRTLPTLRAKQGHPSHTSRQADAARAPPPPADPEPQTRREWSA